MINSLDGFLEKHCVVLLTAPNADVAYSVNF